MSVVAIILLVALVWVGIGLVGLLGMCRVAAHSDRASARRCRELHRARGAGLVA